jgi:hypothetical protein
VKHVDICSLGDAQLLQRTDLLARGEKAVLADLIESLAEVDRRRLWKGTHGSFFEYCVHRLRLHPASAYHRVRAARAVTTFPPLLGLLRDGRLTLEAVVLLNPHLKADDAGALVTKAMSLNHRQLEALLALRIPVAPKPDSIRHLGPPRGCPEPAASPEPPSFLFERESPASPAIAPRRSAQEPPPVQAVRFSFTGDDELLRLVDRARQLLRHKHPDGRLEAVFKEALLDLLRRRDRSWGR